MKTGFLSITLASLALAMSLASTSHVSAVQDEPATVPWPGTGNMKQELDSKVARRDWLRAKYEDLQTQIAEMSAERLSLEEKSLQSGVSEGSWPAIVSDLQKSRIALLVELAGLDARAEAIRKASEAVSDRPEDLEVIGLLERMVILRQQELEQMQKMHEAGHVPQGELSSTEQQVLEARISLAEARARSATPGLAGADEILATISLDRADKHARLQKTESLLAEILPLRVDLEAIARIDERRHATHLQAAQWKHEISKTEEAIRMLEDEVRKNQSFEEPKK